MDRNQRKKEILETIKIFGEMGVTEIVEWSVDMSLESAQVLCLRYTRQGLLRRTFIDGWYLYDITEKGLERLEFLKTYG